MGKFESNKSEEEVMVYFQTHIAEKCILSDNEDSDIAQNADSDEEKMIIK
jgi:hypothetical protein